MREKPLVIIVQTATRSLIGCSAETRREESRRGCETLGVAVSFLGLKDGSLDESRPQERLRALRFHRMETCLRAGDPGRAQDPDVLARSPYRFFPS